MAALSNGSKAAVLFGPPINWNDTRQDVQGMSLAAFKPRYETHNPTSAQMRNSLAGSERSIGASLNSDHIVTAARPTSSTTAHSSSLYQDDEDDTLSQSSYRRGNSGRAGSLRTDQNSTHPSKSKSHGVVRKNVGLNDEAALKGSMVVAHYEYLEGMRTTTPVKAKTSSASASGNRQPTTPRSASKRMSDTRYSLRKGRPATSAMSETSSVDTSASCRSSAVSQVSKSARNGLNSPLNSARSQNHRLRSTSNSQQTASNVQDKRSSVPELRVPDLQMPTSARSDYVKKTPRATPRTPRSNVSLRQTKRELTQRPVYHDTGDGARDQYYDDADSLCNSVVESHDRYPSQKSSTLAEPQRLRASDVSIGQHVASTAAARNEGEDALDNMTCSKNVRQLPPLYRVDDSVDQDQDSVWSKLLNEKLRESQSNPFVPGPRAVRNSHDLFQYRSSPQQQEEKVDIKSVSLEFPKLNASHPLSDSEELPQDYSIGVDSVNGALPRLAGQEHTFRISEEKVDMQASVASVDEKDARNISIEKVDTTVVQVQAVPDGGSDHEEIVVYKHPTHGPVESDEKPGCKCCTIM